MLSLPPIPVLKGEAGLGAEGCWAGFVEMGLKVLTYPGLNKGGFAGCDDDCASVLGVKGLIVYAVIGLNCTPAPG